jgi:beta-mannosidase
MGVKRYELDWEVGPVDTSSRDPQQWVKAQVPGAVQLDWGRAKCLPLPEYAGNVADYRWMEDSFWVYRTRLEFPALGADECAFFVCNGVDYQFEVSLDGKMVRQQEGMFTPFEIELEHPGQSLEIRVFPAPKSHQLGDDRFQANQSVKPAVSYGWDFHPRLIPLGIWQWAGVEIRPTAHIRRFETFACLSEDLSRAFVQVEVDLSQPTTHSLRWQLVAPNGKVVLERALKADQNAIRIAAELDQPVLWWPNGQGEAALYASRVELLGPDGAVSDERSARVGMRTIRLVMHPGQWDDPELDRFPRGPNKPPITLEVNGRRVFGKGSNWVSPDIFPGRIDAELYQTQLMMVQEAHFNLLRCWGGAIVQKDEFFEQCDELGIMVWQEFPLSCNRYESTPQYLAVLDQESKAIIRRLRGHACLALWCGGNELFNNWSKMTEQDLAMRLLNRNTFDLDPHRPFLYTSPQFGMGHGFYCFNLPDGREVFQYLPQANCTAYTEFGVPGPAGSAVLKKIIPPEELFPPRKSEAWIKRHAYLAWDGSETSWLEYETPLRRYFGPIASLDEMVAAGQFIQSEGLKFFFEETRRQKPVCAMGLNWCFNEPWPSAANSSLINWPAEPKPALQAAALACRPVLASARSAKLGWKRGEVFTTELFILNDAPFGLEAGVVKAVLKAAGTEIELDVWRFPALEANTNAQGPLLAAALPMDAADNHFSLLLKVDGHAEWDSEYQFVFLPEVA